MNLLIGVRFSHHMVVRVARTEDIPALIPVILDYECTSVSMLSENYRSLRRMREPIEERLSRNLESCIADSESQLFVYEEEGVVVGYAIGKIREADDVLYDPPRTGEFSELAVLPSHRGKGRASALWNPLLAWFREQGCEFVTLSVNANNTARAVYEKWGFETFYIRMIKKI